MRSRRVMLCVVLVSLFVTIGVAEAVTSTRSVASSFGGNGHNISFDGRLFLVRDSSGWQARLLRPEAITYLPDGLPDAQGPMWSDLTLVLGPSDVVENALAICEPNPTRAPFACDAAGAPSAGGPYDCYDLWILDSDAVTPAAMGGAVLRRRHLTLWVSNPKTPSAQIFQFAWDSAVEPLQIAGGGQLLGIEPTITSDGKLLVWQGHPSNDGAIDILMYSVNANRCAAGGWSTPESISHMAFDAQVIGVYRLAERTLRAADGTSFADRDLVHGAYPWVMANGDAIIFAAAGMPCRGPEDPPGCGPRRNALSVIGYPTNWGVAHIDGGANPDTDNTVRLFFSSPGPASFASLPVTPGLDVWPFFGSNTSNYVELIFDDGLDGQYAGLWHLNESIDWAGDMDKSRSPDVSGYFNTAILRGGMQFALANDGVIGKSLTFDGVDDYLEVPDAPSLSPVNGITIDMMIRPTVEPDCDANANYRLLLGKGNIGDGAYTIVFEENRSMQARVFVGGAQQSLFSPQVPLGVWTRVAFEYDGPSGKAAWYFDDVQVATADLTPGTIAQTNYPLTIGAAGASVACPNGNGAFAGQLDEVSVSRVARHLFTPPPPPPDAGPGDPMPDAATPPGQPDAGGGTPGDGDGSGGCGCRAGTRGGSGAPALILLALLFAVVGCRHQRRG